MPLISLEQYVHLWINEGAIYFACGSLNILLIGILFYYHPSTLFLLELVENAFHLKSFAKSFYLSLFLSSTAILPFMGWLIWINIYYTTIHSDLDYIYAILRFSSCCILTSSSVAILSFTFEPHILFWINGFVYSIYAMGYSWMVPMLRWYFHRFKVNGGISYLPRPVRRVLMETTLMEWLSDTSLVENIKRYYPFFFQLSESERKAALCQFSPTTRGKLGKKGVVHLLPRSFQDFLLPQAMKTELVSIPPVNIPSNGSCGFSFTSKTPRNTALETIILNRIAMGLTQTVNALPARNVRIVTLFSTAFLLHQIMGSPPKQRKVYLSTFRVLLTSTAGITVLAGLGIQLIQMVKNPQHPVLHQLLQEGKSKWSQLSSSVHSVGNGDKDTLISSGTLKISLAAVFLWYCFRRRY